MTDERSLPWLQDTEDVSVWTAWNVTWRDVRILDSQNRLFAVYNLTENSLADVENREALKNLFLAAATVVDANNDNLPDDWEQQYLGKIAAAANDDSDNDGRDNFNEFAFGTDPRDPKSTAIFKPSVGTEGGQTFFSVTFRRRAGAILDYVVEASEDLQHWSPASTDVKIKSAPRNLFDGTGTSEVTYSLTKPIVNNHQSFIRVRAIPRQR